MGGWKDEISRIPVLLECADAFKLVMGLTLKKAIYFHSDLILEAQPICRPPRRMLSKEMRN